MAKQFCAHCGKRLDGHGLLFDRIDIFCNCDCAAKFFGGDHGCVSILIDDGRLEWGE